MSDPVPLPYGTPSSSPPPHRRATGIAWAVILVVVGGIGVRTWLAGRRATPGGSAAADVQMVLAGRVTVGVSTLLPATDASRAQSRQSFEQAAADGGRPGDRLRAAVVAAELVGPAAGLADLDAAGPVIAGDRLAGVDAAALRHLYRTGELTDGERAGLVDRLGFFGQLAASQRKGADAADRAAVLGPARRSAVTAVVAGVTVVVAFVAGLALLVVGIVLFATGKMRWRFDPSAAVAVDGRPVWLEAFAVWLGLYVATGLALRWLPVHLPIWAGEVALVGVTAVAVGWAAWRGGLSSAAARSAVGLTAGQGFFREVGLGLVGYLAGLPVLAAGFGVTATLMKLSHAKSTHPIVAEFRPGMGAGAITALLLLAAVGAPVLEETMFRGALYGHLRRRHRAWVSAAVVAVLFAAVHPQGWAAVPALGSIALVLAALREWRGSLVGPMAAHALNNGVVVAVLALALG